MSTPLIVGLASAATAYARKYTIQACAAFEVRPPRDGRYERAFQPKMTRREAALILGVIESASLEKVNEAHRRVMAANHPNAGGNYFLVSKINEGKALLFDAPGSFR